MQHSYSDQSQRFIIQSGPTGKETSNLQEKYQIHGGSNFCHNCRLLPWIFLPSSDHPIGVDDTEITSPNGNRSSWCDWMVCCSRESQLSVSHPLKMPCSDRATRLRAAATAIHPSSRATRHPDRGSVCPHPEKLVSRERRKGSTLDNFLFSISLKQQE